ncbi:hypothetical protein FACS18942_02520 [Planctomycetales bacterium]|nr:hypothetical protein FACS18942_02520 [Planctomycetales bacterium]GHT36089.1 hypothetical protein FACS189427_07030 [Planctomycetales bacterium]
MANYEEELRKYSEKADMDDVLEKEEYIERKSGQGALAKFVESIKTLFSLLKDYKNGKYTQVPLTSIATIAGTLLYIFSPIDLIPDAIPVLGLADDAAVLGICLKSINSVLKGYLVWKTLTDGAKTLIDNVFDTCMDNVLRQAEEWFSQRLKDWQSSFRYTLGFDAAFIVIANLPQFMPHTYGILLLWGAVMLRMAWTGVCFYYCVRDLYPNRVMVCRFSRVFFREFRRTRSLSKSVKETVEQAFCSIYYERTPDAVQRFHSAASFIKATPSVSEMAEKAAERSCPLLRKYILIMLRLGLFSVVFYGIAIVIIRMYLVYYAVNMNTTQFLLFPFTLLF